MSLLKCLSSRKWRIAFVIPLVLSNSTVKCLVDKNKPWLKVLCNTEIENRIHDFWRQHFRLFNLVTIVSRNWKWARKEIMSRANIRLSQMYRYCVLCFYMIIFDPIQKCLLFIHLDLWHLKAVFTCSCWSGADSFSPLTSPIENLHVLLGSVSLIQWYCDTRPYVVLKKQNIQQPTFKTQVPKSNYIWISWSGLSSNI